MTYIKASEIGCALDCDLASGRNKHNGGTATDDGPRINAAMAGASASNPLTLILDGSALISGLFLPAGGYWSIQGQGCLTGFFIKTGTNEDGIHNGGPTANIPADPGPGVTLPARGSNVTLANFVLNGNRGTGTNGDSTTGDPRGPSTTWDIAINLMNLNNILVENVVVVNAPSYHFRFSNVGHVTVSGCVMKSSGANTDGLHFDGPANDITISNCDFTLDDDGIALNCPEGYSGNISRVAVSNCTFNSISLMRLYTAYSAQGQFTIDNVTVTDCSGWTRIAAFLVGAHGFNNPNALLELSVSNCRLTADTILDLTTDFSSIKLSDVTMVPFGDPSSKFAFAQSYTGNQSYTGRNLQLENCTIERNGEFGPGVALILSGGSTLQNLEINGLAVKDVGGTFSELPELLNIVYGSIGQVTMDAVTSKQIAAPVNAGGFANIGSVAGAGVLATGWEFPDTVMANGSPYLSATSHQPSIKVGGVVKPYP